jgi:hypothetical protein
MSRRIRRIQRMRIRRMVAMPVQTCRFPSGGVGEDIITITTAIIADFAMEGIRGMDGGGGE